MKKTIGLIFSGYGEQFVTMGKDLYNESRQVQDLFEQASMCMDKNFVQLCFASSAAEIAEIDKGYLAILLTQVSIYSELAQAGLRPDFIAGYGIGEYAATVASGSLSFSDALYLLNKYAKIFKTFIQEHPDFAVLQVPKGFTKESLEALCSQLSTDEKKIFIAAHNTEHSFYVAGHSEIIEALKEYCKVHEIRKVKQVNIAYGLHSQLSDSVVEALSPYFFKIDFKPLKFPVITNVDGAYVTSPEALESAILRRINSPIVWDELMDGFIGCEILVCVGPGQQVMEWAQQKYPEKTIYSIQNLADIKSLQAILAQASLQAHIPNEVQTDKAVVLGTCHLDDEVMVLPDDLTLADLINELPSDYDIDED